MPPGSTSAHGLPADPAIPGFSVALDPPRMHTLLQPRFEDAGYQLRLTKLDRFRYRPAERAVAVYSLDIEDGRSGRIFRTFGAGRIHAARAPKPASVRVGETGLPTRIDLSEIGMRIEVFPYDQRLPAAVEIAHGPSPRIVNVLGRIWKRPDIGAADIRLEPVRYRAGLSATFSCARPAEGQINQSLLFAKVTAGAEVGDDHTAAARTAVRLAEKNGLYRIALPAAVEDGGTLTVYEEAKGENLAALLSADGPVQPLARKTAALLRTLHQLEVDRLPDTFTSDVSDKIYRAVRLIAWACPDLGREACDVGRLALSCVSVPLRAPTHRDMKPDHIFIRDEEMELIDNGSICLGNPVTDWGALDARLKLASALGLAPSERVSTFRRLLESAYFDAVPATWRRHAGAARAYGALIVSTHLIQSLMLDWRALVRGELCTALSYS